MNKCELEHKTEVVMNETKDALQTMYDALNHGQQQQIIKNPSVAILFERYGVTT